VGGLSEFSYQIYISSCSTTKIIHPIGFITSMINGGGGLFQNPQSLRAFPLHSIKHPFRPQPNGAEINMLV
jgi:hypothetical protein